MAQSVFAGVARPVRRGVSAAGLTSNVGLAPPGPTTSTAGVGASSGGSSGGGGGIVLPAGVAFATKPRAWSPRSLQPTGLPSQYRVNLKHGNTYAIGLALSFPASLLPASELVKLGADITQELGASFNCDRCGFFKAGDSPYKRAGGPDGATHVGIVQYTGQDREVDTAADPSGQVRWLDDVTSVIFPKTVVGEPAESSAWPWIIGGVFLAGLAGLVYWGPDLVE